MVTEHIIAVQLWVFIVSFGLNAGLIILIPSFEIPIYTKSGIAIKSSVSCYYMNCYLCIAI